LLSSECWLVVVLLLLLVS